MMRRILGAVLGGTTVGGHHALESVAVSLMTPPNFGSGAGSCFPSMVVVAPGEPGVPVVWICARAEGATVIRAAASIPQRKNCLVDSIDVNRVLCCRSKCKLQLCDNFVVLPAICL